ncbi:MAG: class I adenylate-forming enzyme family protein [Myxococcota bacterium]
MKRKPLELRLQADESRYCAPRFLEDVVSRGGKRPALRFEGSELSYAELNREVRGLAKGLVAAGVSKGAQVGVLMANRPEWVVASFAIGLVGGVLIPVNTFATPDERDYILRHSDASLLLLQRRLLGRDLLEELEEAHPEIGAALPGSLHCAALPALRGLVAFGGPSRGAVRGWQEFLVDGEGVADELLDEMAAEVTPADDGVIIYTSGTTAHPKGVLHFQRASVIQSWRFAEYMELGPDDVVWTAQPFFWSAGMAMSLGATLAAGACLVMQETFEPGEALALIEQEHATTLHAWPHQEKALAEHPRAATTDFSSVRKIEFSSPLAPLAGLEKDEWGTYGSYGLSETFTLASALPASAAPDLRQETSGLPLPGTLIRILDLETGETLAQGEKGEVAVKGATLMRGYYKVDPSLYFDADGYFHTQDGGWFDEDGYLHWTGRLSNLIKTGGANVSPLEIERALLPSDEIRDGLAVGVPHPVLGEAIVLCAVRADGATIDEPSREQSIRKQLREKLAAYKVPKRVLFFDAEELDYTANQKVQVGPLRETALARLQQEGAEIDGVRYGDPG